MPPLDGALAFEKMHDVPVAVRQDLDLHVTRPRHCLLDVYPRIAERAQGLPLRRGQRGVEVLRSGDQPHSLAAAAGGRLEHDRIPDGECVILRFGLAPFGNGLLQSGHDRDSGLDDLAPGPRLLAHLLDRLGRGTDEQDPGTGAGAREGGVLGEEAVSRVDGVRASRLAGGDHAVDDKIALARGRGTHPHRFVAAADVQRGAVRIAVDGDRADAHLPAGARYPHRDLAAIGDQDLADAHGGEP